MNPSTATASPMLTAGTTSMNPPRRSPYTASTAARDD